MTDPEAIAMCALRHYDQGLGTAGKPTQDEWTVYAAIVAHQHHTTDDETEGVITEEGIQRQRHWVVSCATGSKCTVLGPEGWVLRDGHAEVLCRRGLVRELWKEILAAERGSTAISSECNNNESLLEPLQDANIDCKAFRLRPDISLHLYISDSPCGDASIYPLQNDTHLFTGAKRVAASCISEQHTSTESTLLPGGTIEREPQEQALGVLRTKAGRSNLPVHLRSHSMACSDKLLRWCLLGLQGENHHLLSYLSHSRIHLSSVCVSRDPRAVSMEAQRGALERATLKRAEAAMKEIHGRENLLTEQQTKVVKQIALSLPSMHVVDATYARGKAVTDFAKQNKHRRVKYDEQQPIQKRSKLSSPPCGFSLNWQNSTPLETEIVVGARGIRQGKKPKSEDDYQRLTSRLSRASNLVMCTGKGDYLEWKAHHKDNLRDLVFSTHPFQGWLVKSSAFRIDDDTRTH